MELNEEQMAEIIRTCKQVCRATDVKESERLLAVLDTLGDKRLSPEAVDALNAAYFHSVVGLPSGLACDWTGLN